MRESLCNAARSWIATPYRHHAMVKGAGIDCAHLLIAVYSEAGLIEAFDPGHYSPDWWMHQSEERFLGWVERFAHPVESPEPGDIAVYKFGRCFAHGAIVLEWPNIVHAYFRSRMCEYALGDQGDLKDRPVKFYSLLGAAP